MLLAVVKKLVFSVTPLTKLQTKMNLLIGLCVTCATNDFSVTVWEMMFQHQSMLPNLSAKDA